MLFFLWEWNLKGCSYSAVATAIYLSQLADFMELNVIFAIAPCEHFHCYPTEPNSPFYIGFGPCGWFTITDPDSDSDLDSDTIPVVGS